MIGRLERVELREVWKHEAYDFTVWLEQNCDILGDTLGFSLSNIEREKSAGVFSVDLVGEDNNGNSVIIENQLEKSNHDHLGKVLTYLAAIEAKIAVWIVSEPRPEHVKAFAWLNDSSSASFYLLKVEAVRINNSDPAPLLTLIVGPSEDSKLVVATKKAQAGRNSERYEFWSQLLQKLKQRNFSLHSNLSPTTGSWIAATAGKAGHTYNYVVNLHDSRIELYIDKGTAFGVYNRECYDYLHEHRDAIQAALTVPRLITWESLDERNSCRISIKVDTGGLLSCDNWGELQDDLIDSMIAFKNAIQPFIDGCPIKT